MPRVHSHYENLKVERNARPDAIRAAYRALSRRHHPDRNPGNADASRVMSVINVAYEVLSDPVRKREHDRWIARTESADERVRASDVPAAAWQRDAPFTPFEPPARPRAAPVPSPGARRLQRGLAHLARFGVVYGLVGIALVAVFHDRPVNLTQAPSARVAAAPAPAAAPIGPYAPPAEAPNGQRWPEQSGYVAGYERRNTGGLSELTIDNAGNGADMFAKLVALDGGQAYAARVVWVRAGTRFKLTEIAPGTYDLRYRNLGDGRLSRSQFFTLEEVPTAEGPRPSRLTVSLDPAREGTLQSYGLTEAEF
jgi:DnaJ domain